MGWIDLPLIQVTTQTDLEEATAGGVTVTRKFAAGIASASGDNQVVAAVTGKRILVTSIRLFTDDVAVDCVFRSATTAIDGTAYTASQSGYTEFDAMGLFQTATGEALNLNLSAAEDVSYRITYFEV